jgi:hypothetical protein
VDFEAMLKGIVVLGAFGVTVLVLAVGFKTVFFRRRQQPRNLENEQIEALQDRLDRTELKVTELEERLDFAERVLAESRGKDLRLKP